MLAMEVVKNGRKLCVAGYEDLSVLTAHFTAGGLLGPKTWDFTGKKAKVHMHLHVGGLTSRRQAPDDHVDWIGHMEILIGDEIKLKFVEVSEADRPAETRPAKRKSPSADEREFFKALEEQYLRMRKKFRTKGLTTRSTRTRAKAARAGGRER